LNDIKTPIISSLCSEFMQILDLAQRL